MNELNKVMYADVSARLKLNPLVIVLNGPMHSGKDTIGARIQQIVGPDICKLFAFKDELFRMTMNHYGFTQSQLDHFYLPENKEQPQPELGGISIRQALINVSENIIKPKHGDMYFGRAVADAIMLTTPRPLISVITDSGFDSEFQGMVEHLPITFRFLVVKICRNNCSYGPNDSRNYLDDGAVAKLGGCVYVVENNGTVEDVAHRILSVAGEFHSESTKN